MNCSLSRTGVFGIGLLFAIALPRTAGAQNPLGTFVSGSAVLDSSAGSDSGRDIYP